MIHTTHTTTYLYSEQVSICHTEVRLAPRSGPSQRIVEHQLVIQPPPESTSRRTDYFGNEVTYFSIYEPHQTLTVTAQSLVERAPVAVEDPPGSQPWEEVREEVRRYAEPATFDAYQFVFESPRVTCGPEFAAYAETSFPAGRPLLDAALDLCHRVHREFHYDRRATTVTTPVADVLKTRRGVCQDFAHLTIACLRSLGLPARYVSGYLGDERLTGGEASHAWVSIFSPGSGWIDLDPTNDVRPNGRHITLAWGRDYSDVAPVKGVALGGGQQVINVVVEVSTSA